MGSTPTRSIVLSGLFIALGVLIPLAFHSIGSGTLLLPMFWPVALACIFLPLSLAVTIGASTPVISFLLTGMPPVSPPVLQIMIPELIVFTFTSSFLMQKKNMKPVPALFTGMVSSRMFLAFFYYVLSPFFGLPGSVVSIGAVIHSIPGAVIVITVIPVIAHMISSSEYAHNGSA